jgi:hypothetical protein
MTWPQRSLVGWPRRIAIVGAAIIAAVAAVAVPAIAVAAGPAGSSQAALPIAARIDVQVQLQTAETSLQQDIEARISAMDANGLDLDRTPLAVPLLAPLVRGAVLDHGTFPAASQTVEAEAQPPLKVERHAGGLRLRGQLPPGSVGTVRARTIIGVRDARLALGLRGVAAQTWATVVVLSAAPARVQLQVDQPARVSAAEQGAERLVGAALAQPLRAGEVAVFAVADLPVAARAPQRALAVLAVVAVAAMVWLVGLQRRRAGVGAHG